MRIYSEINAEYICAHCHNHVSVAKLFSGVNNRNHCPYCLWSRHMDLLEAGDRLSACKGLMHPVGLTHKPSRNKYAAQAIGELMLIHQCVECEAISINRIAADDVLDVILDVFETSSSISSMLLQKITKSEIVFLGEDKINLVHRQLYGQMHQAGLFNHPLKDHYIT